MLKSKINFLGIVLPFLDTDNGKIISYFPTIKKNQGSCFMSTLERNAPK